MMASGNLLKMKTRLNNPIDYFLVIGNQEIYLNEHIGRNISFVHTGIINCIHCGNATKKSFNQGFCYNCFQNAPEADQSVVRPELSMAQFGIARDLDWANEHDLIDHYVYLSITNDLKVGVTRHHQIPTRWIDQGAIQAIKLAKTPNRHIAGIIESFLKNYVADITKWQLMLKDEQNRAINLSDEKIQLINLLPKELQQYADTDHVVTELNYPGEHQLQNIKSVDLGKLPEYEGKLLRIKGQYLIFDDDSVINIRKHSGYFVNFAVKE